MSYCNQDWISLYHHERLINNAKFDPQFIETTGFRPPDLFDPWLWPWEYIPDPPAWEKNGWNWRFLKAAPVISLIGLVNSDREIEVQSVMRVTALPQTENAHETEFTAELVDQNQKSIARAPLMRLSARGGGCCGGDGGGNGHDSDARGPYIFQALIPDIADGASLRITRRPEDEKEQPGEVWTRSAPKNPPRISGFEVYARESTGHARWEVAEACGEKLEFSLQFSKDDGKSWNGLAVALTGMEFRFDLATLPSGEVIFALLAHDGFFSAKSISAPVCLPARPPVIAIMHPHEGDTLLAGQPMRLWVSVSTGTARPVEDRACRWLLDDREVAHGLEAWISDTRRRGASLHGLRGSRRTTGRSHGLIHRQRRAQPGHPRRSLPLTFERGIASPVSPV